MTMDQQARSAKSSAKRKDLGEKDCVFAKGEKEDLKVLMDWTSDKQQGSVMAACLRYVRSLGREGAIEALRSRRKIEVSENVAAELYARGQRQASKLDAEDA
jgi:hypothetical protein